MDKNTKGTPAPQPQREKLASLKDILKLFRLQAVEAQQQVRSKMAAAVLHTAENSDDSGASSTAVGGRHKESAHHCSRY